MTTHNAQTMLDHTKIQDDYSVEKEFCVPFTKLPIRQLTREESLLLMGIVVQYEQGKGASSIEEVYSDKIPDSVQMAQGALKSRFTFTIPDSIVLFICFSSRSIGDVIMYFTYLQYRAKLLDRRKLTIDDFVNIFPRGLPTEESLSKMWDAQKVERDSSLGMSSDNLIDYPTATKSIQFQKADYEEVN